jgi:hypothetical protein
MERKSNYYTPELSEFYIGFEYDIIEFASINDGPKNLQWISKIFDGRKYGWWDIQDAIKVDKVRVKYLDREDTESFGFINNKLPWQAESDTHIFIKMREENQFIIRDKRCDDQIFGGTIKNKSEFKKLLIQLGIYETTTK